MRSVRKRAGARRAVSPSAAGFHLADLGVHVFDRHETTFLLNTLPGGSCGALGNI